MKVYVINLPSAEERRESITHTLNKLGLRFEFVVPEESHEVVSNREDWSAGANSLRLTTIKLIEKAIKNEEDCIWIWEDDACVDETFFNLFYSRLDKAPEYDFLMLNYDSGTLYNTCKNGFRRIKNGVLRCTSYIIHNSIYEEYLRELQIERPIDWSTMCIHRSRKRSFVVEPKPVYQEVGKYSYIRDKIVNY